MHRTLPTILHALLFSTVVVVVPCVVSPNSVMATVVIPEPNDQTARGSDIIAVCVVESVQGEPPFTQENPPDLVVFEVEKAIKGCGLRDTLGVSEWVSKAKPRGRYRIFGHTPPSAESIEEWKETPVAIPQRGTPVLLFLTRSDGDTLEQYFNGWGQPVFFEDPSEEQILLVTGWASLDLDIRLTGWTFPGSSPIVVRGTLRNVSESEQTLDPKNIVIKELRTPEPHPSLANLMGLQVKRIPPPMTLDAGERREFEWDLCDILPIYCTFPGRYRVELQIPAKCREVKFRFWIVDGLTFEDAVESCPIVFIGTVQKIHSNPDGTVKVVFAEHQHLKMIAFAGGKPFRWPQDRFPLPKEGDSLIVCVDGFDPKTRLPEILYVAKRTEELVNTVRSMLRRRPPTE